MASRGCEGSRTVCQYRFPELQAVVSELIEQAERFADELIQASKTQREAATSGAKRHLPNDDGKPQVKRRSRLKLSAKCILQDWFERNYEYPYPTRAEKMALVEKCGKDVTASMITNWFFNARKRVNWRQLSAQAAALKAERQRPQ
ncbi:Homeobox domain-containing protein [Plasmodiophora brassicae]|uniref:Homeobox domain-containing protein n=1 Tax=Plasmodiophora brassicae TaxID=37360 RepID=A0A0G4J6X4_PLABS|nr:hypothetical protein PBRA_009264 [Plasmodiophora brassicae]